MLKVICPQGIVFFLIIRLPCEIFILPVQPAPLCPVKFFAENSGAYLSGVAPEDGTGACPQGMLIFQIVRSDQKKIKR